jgi:cell division protein FtsW
MMFFVLMMVSVHIARCARDLFGTLLATGITSLITLQALFNMAVTMGLVPTKGLPLPFVSYGGTASMVFLTMVGILLNIGKQAEEPQGQLMPAYAR